MKYTKSILLVLGLFIFTNLYAGKRPVIYVAAPNGLSLREEPNSSSKRIELLAYGTKISNYNSTQIDTIIDGYRGSWLRVALNGKDGYIFSGYTIPVIPPGPSVTSLSKFFIENFGEPVKMDSIIRNEGDILKTVLYKKSVFYQESYDFINEYSVINLNMSVQQAYLLFYLLEQNIPNLIGYQQKILPSFYPDKKYKKDNIWVEASEYYEFEITNGCAVFNIIKLHSGVIVSWYECP